MEITYEQQKAILEFYTSINKLTIAFNYNATSETNLKLLEQIINNIKQNEDNLVITK